MFDVGSEIDGQFVVTERHEGGMGVVLVAVDRITQHRYAIKTLKPELLDRPGALERFRQEARAWLAVGTHPNLVAAAIYREIEGVPLLFIEYVDGPSLAELLRQEKHLFLPQAVQFAIQVARGMAYLHSVTAPTGERGIVHRDLKPANVLITRRCVAKVTDFGLAKLAGDIAELAEGRRGMGTLYYMPPEQLLDAASADQRSDIYSFGAMLYALIAGRPPLRAATAEAMAQAIVHQQPPPLKEQAQGVPDELNELVMACLAKRRQDRPESFEEIYSNLRQIWSRHGSAMLSARHATCAHCGYRTARRWETCPVCMNPMARAEEKPRVDEARRAQLLQRAREHAEAGRLDHAVAVLRQAASLFPGDAEITEMLDSLALKAAQRRGRAARRAAAADWPMECGGPSRAGIAAEEISPPLAHDWQVQIADWIVAAPAVARGVVVAGGHVDEPGRHGRLCAVRLASGEIIWEVVSPHEFVASPAIAGGRIVVAASGTRAVAVALASGQVMWEADVGATVFTPILVTGSLALLGTEAGTFHALDVSSGREVWQFRARGPILAGACTDAGSAYVPSLDNRLYALDLGSGKPMWEFATGGEIHAMPSASGGAVYVGSSDERLYCIDAASGKRRWDLQVGAEIHSAPAVAETAVVVGTRGRTVVAADPQTGRLRWRFQTGDWVDSSPAISGRIVFFGSHDGHLYAVERESGVLLWRVEVGAEIPAGVAISGGRIILPCRDGYIRCLKAR